MKQRIWSHRSCGSFTNRASIGCTYIPPEPNGQTLPLSEQYILAYWRAVRVPVVGQFLDGSVNAARWYQMYVDLGCSRGWVTHVVAKNNVDGGLLEAKLQLASCRLDCRLRTADRIAHRDYSVNVSKKTLSLLTG